MYNTPICRTATFIQLLCANHILYQNTKLVCLFVDWGLLLFVFDFFFIWYCFYIFRNKCRKKQHTFSMCMRRSTTLSLYLWKIMRIPLNIFPKLSSGPSIFFSLIVFFYFIFCKHFTTKWDHASRSPCNLYVSIGKQSIDRYLLDQYALPMQYNSRGAIETQMVTKCVYEFVSAMTEH